MTPQFRIWLIIFFIFILGILTYFAVVTFPARQAAGGTPHASRDSVLVVTFDLREVTVTPDVPVATDTPETLVATDTPDVPAATDTPETLTGTPEMLTATGTPETLTGTPEMLTATGTPETLTGAYDGQEPQDNAHTHTPTIAIASPPPTGVSPQQVELDETATILTSGMTNTVPAHSPYYKKTWVTYYGRPNVAVMGILGEYQPDDLSPKLREQADAYDQANGKDTGVMPAFHLVYGMATKLPGFDSNYLSFLKDDVVMTYIEAARREGFAVILDIQIGALTPAGAIQRGFPFLQYENVHLALDPEFAMSHPEQTRPGLPVGFVTAAQVNEAQRVMRDYMNANNIQGPRILLLHQFLQSMIVDKDSLERFEQIELTITVDGWGGPQAKISKYNAFTKQSHFFTGFKLFYGWDTPLLTPAQALGLERYDDNHAIEVMPNLIIYQ